MNGRSENSSRSEQSVFNNVNVRGNITTGDITQIVKQPIVQKPSRPQEEKNLLEILKGHYYHDWEPLLNVPPIELAKELQPSQVEWSASNKIPFRKLRSEELDKSILEVFEEGRIKKLLILGDAGIGKTTSLYKLAELLINENVEKKLNYPIPVIFSLSSWRDDGQSMPNWMVAELKSKYGIGVDIGKGLLKKKRLLPMLDGLDEVQPARQERCVHEINQFLTSEWSPLYIVICSRKDEYENLYLPNKIDKKLQLNNAIYLKPLDENKIEQYLQDQYSKLWQAIQKDSSLLDLAKIPLWLCLMIWTYDERYLPEWLEVDSTDERRKKLFDAYIEYRLVNDRSKNKKPKPKQTKRWLALLAKRLKEENLPYLLIEKIQPTWLPKPSQQIYRVGVLLISWVMFSVIWWLLFVTSSWAYYMSFEPRPHQSNWYLFFALILGTVSFIPVYLRKINEPIKTVESIKWSWVNAKKEFKFGWIIGWCVALLFCLFFCLLNLLSGNLSLKETLQAGLIVGFVLSVIFGLIFGTMNGLSGPDLEITQRKHANQGIYNSAINSIIYWLISGLIIAPIAGFISYFFGGIDKIFVSVIIGLNCGLFIGLILVLNSTAGRVCIQHFALRLLLLHNNCTPWNYSQFLDYATERLLLRRIGGRYQFIHDLLKERMQEMYKKFSLEDL